MTAQILEKSCCSCGTPCDLPYMRRHEIRIRNKGNCPQWTRDEKYHQFLVQMDQECRAVEAFAEHLQDLRKEQRRERFKKIWTSFCQGFWGVFGVRR